MRVPSELWVKALIRRCQAAGVPVMVVHHGDDKAGSVFVKVARLDGTALLFGPAPASFLETAATPSMIPHLDPLGAADGDVESYLARQAEYDPDLWVVEIEDRQGRAFIED